MFELRVVLDDEEILTIRTKSLNVAIDHFKNHMVIYPFNKSVELSIHDINTWQCIARLDYKRQEND